MKMWWARVSSDGGYGRWVPTGCIDKQEAVDYMQTYPGTRTIVEWLQL